MISADRSPLHSEQCVLTRKSRNSVIMIAIECLVTEKGQKQKSYRLEKRIERKGR